MQKETMQLVGLDRQRTLLAHIDALLGWDQETYLPKSAVEERAEQIALVQGLTHEKAVDPRIAGLLGSLERNPDLQPLEKAYLRVSRREYDKETKLPPDFVMELARQTSLSQAAWAEARSEDNFALFAPHLETMIRLNKQMAAYLNPNARPYDVLLDLYEEGSTEKSIASVFAEMKADLVRILGKIQSKPQIDDSFLHRRVPADKQALMSQYLMDAVGFEKDKGRLDITAHPFTTTVGKTDIRITTRYIEDYFPSSIFSTIHESGHALYEMGIDPDPEFWGTRLAEPVSMAVHESQSRMWENLVGRSRAFWR
ncbi:MAG: carboxypeptidase M32, partial [Spirochaetaceae bacterium]|nr:carboxypeptidase M32 [Spirochaetaceae bacterium]